MMNLKRVAINFSNSRILSTIYLPKLLVFLLLLLLIVNRGYAQRLPPPPPQPWQVQGILTALDDPEPRVQAAALERAVEYDLSESEFLKIIPESRVGQIAALLDSEIDEVQETAIKAVGRMGEAAKEQAPKLVELLEARYFFLRKSAAEALGRMGEAAKEQIPKLLKLMQTESPNGEISHVAAEALGRMGEAAKEQIPKLLELLQDPEGNARSEALFALEKMGATAKSSAPVMAALLEDPTLNSSLKLQIVHLLVQWGKATQEDAFRLLEPLGRSNSDVQIAAAKALGQMGETAAAVAPRLVELLQDSEPESDIRRGAAMALGQMGQAARTQLPQIIALLQHPNPDIRRAAAQALGGIGATAQDQLPKLLELLQDPHPEVRRWAVDALGDMGAAAREAAPALVKSLSDSYFYAWKWAIDALGAIGRATGEYPPELVQLLDNPDPVLRSRAVLALGEMKQTAKEIVPRMAELLEDPDPSVRRATLRALKSMGKSAQNAAPNIAQLLNDSESAPTELPENWSEYESQESIRQLALEALGEIGEGAKAQIPQLAKLLDDPEVGLTTALALAKMGMPAREYAPQIATFLSEQAPDVFLYPDYVLNQGQSLALHLEKMGPLDRETALALLNAIYVPPSFNSLRSEESQSKAYFSAKTRFYAYYLCSSDPDAVTLIQWLGHPQQYPSNLKREQGVKVLQAFADAWTFSEPFPKLRQDLAIQIAKVVGQVEWQIDDLPLLRTHYDNLKQGNFKQPAETVREVLNRFAAWRRAWRGLVNLLSLSDSLPVLGVAIG